MTGDLLSPLWGRQDLPPLTLVQWEHLLSQARRARLVGRLAWWLHQRGLLEQVPASPRVHLQVALRHVQRQRDEVQWEADCIRRAIGHLPTSIVLLKGAAYVMAALPPADGRVFADIDILVDRRQLRAVELALFAAGWIAGRLDPYDERYYRDWMHELPPLQHVERGSSLDVHHTITPPTSRFAVDASGLLKDARSLPEQPRLSVLAPADMVLHSAVHLMQEGDFSAGLRDLLDIADLLQTFERTEPAFWPSLVARARALGLGLPLCDALRQIQRLTGIEPPAALFSELKCLAPWQRRNQIMDALLVRALRPDHPDCDTRWTGLARWLLYVRSHWLRMPWYQILPHLLRKAIMRARTRGGARHAPRRAAGPGL
jgi:hypothetical protein